jgi:8-oxo-dGTP diphosphatase
MMQKMPSIGVGIIIRKGAQVLLLRRKFVHGAGSWSTPGGHLEFNESPEECAIREAKEETGLDIKTARFVAMNNDVFEAEEKHYITLWMESDYSGGEPVLGAPYESDTIGWFSWDNLPQPLFIPFQHLISGQCYPPQATGKPLVASKTEFNDIIQRALAIRRLYGEYESQAYGTPWTNEELALGFMGDVGDLAKLVMAANGRRRIPEAQSKLAHELADCLWSVIILAERQGIDLEQAFLKTMDDLENFLQHGPVIG